MIEVDGLPSDAVMVAENGSTMLVHLEEHKIQPYVVFSRKFTHAVYHKEEAMALLCLNRQKDCKTCIATEEKCRNKEEDLCLSERRKYGNFAS